MSDYDDELLPVGAYTGREEDDAPCIRMGVDEEAPKVDDFTRFIASTDREDRHGTVIDQATWDLGDYRRNPVVLLNHRSGSLPIGRSEVIEVLEKGKRKRPRLELGVRWDVSDPEAAVVAGKYARGFMNAGSVSFIPVKVTDRSKLPEDHFAHRKPREGDSPWYPSVFFEKQKLTEFSGVTIPSNVEAEALRAWGARHVSPALAEIEAAAIAATEDPDERVRRVVAEFLTRERVGLVMGALDVPEVGARVRAVVFPAAPRPPAPSTKHQDLESWWTQEKP